MNDTTLSTRSRSKPHESYPEHASVLLQLVSSGRAIGFFAHLIAYILTCLLVLLVAGMFPALITAMSWGIGLVLHGFFALFVPLLRLARSEDVALSQSYATEGADEADELNRLAHEIRGPLRAVKTLVQQIALNPGAVDNAQHAQDAIAELERLERSFAENAPAERARELPKG